MTTHVFDPRTPHPSSVAIELPRSAWEPISGPIVPIDLFDAEIRRILDRYVQEDLIGSVVRDGVTYVGYDGVYGGMLPYYVESEYDSPAAWDGTYAACWSPRHQVPRRFMMPRGFKDPVRSDFFPRIALHRESTLVTDGQGELRRKLAAYPRHVADRAAEMFRALCRQEGFVERFRQAQRCDDEEVTVQALDSFTDYEAGLIRTFASEGLIRLCRLSDGQYVAEDELMYYDVFAARIVEEEHVIDFDLNVGGNDYVEVKLDGSFTYGWPWRVPTPLRLKQAGRTDC